MKLTQCILAGIALLLLSVPAYGEVIINKSNNSITVTSTKDGVKGFRGCEKSSLEEVPAYIFVLQYQKNGKPEGVCSAGSLGNWGTHSTIESEKNTVSFENLEEGNYRVICLSGEAIGCHIEESEDQSIVYAKDQSNIINLGSSVRENNVTQVEAVQNNELKVFPNPANDKINIQLFSNLLNGELEIRLLNVFGAEQKLISREVYEKGTPGNWEMDIAHFPSGTYMVQVIDQAGQALFQKVVFVTR